MNLSREYFASLLNQEDSPSSAADEGKEVSHKKESSTLNVSLGANERLDDIDLGVTPFAHDSSPIKGIIKNTSEVVHMFHIIQKNFLNFILAINKAKLFYSFFLSYQTP